MSVTDRSIRETIQILKKTYKAIDLRFLVIRNNKELTSIFSSIHFTKKDKQTILKEQQHCFDKIELQKHNYAEIIFDAKSITHFNEIIHS